MTAISRSFLLGAIIFAASVFGIFAQGAAPPDMLNMAKASVGAMTGLMALLLALVLGLLIWTAFAVFATQQADAFSLVPLIAEIDLSLEKCGPEAAPARAGLRAALASARERFYGGGKAPQMLTIRELKATLNGLNEDFDMIVVEDSAKRKLVENAQSLARRFQDTQVRMLRQLTNPFPPRVLDVVVIWSALLFFGDGLIGAPNPITFAANLAGACGIALALVLILELSQPYSGFIRLSPAGLDRILKALEDGAI